MLDLYAHTWDGTPPGADEYVISRSSRGLLEADIRGAVGSHVEAATQSPHRSGVDGLDTVSRDIRVRGGRGASTEAGVGDRDSLGGAVVAAGRPGSWPRHWCGPRPDVELGRFYWFPFNVARARTAGQRTRSAVARCRMLLRDNDTGKSPDGMVIAVPMFAG